MPARWTTLEIPPDDPGLAPFRQFQGKPTAQIQMLQSGTAWQAEEAREGGRRRRYYGFVGRYELARVPAEEVEFPAPWNSGWIPISTELDGRLVAPGARDDGRLILEGGVPAGRPLIVSVALRNRRGIESPAPIDNARTADGLALREGVAIRLSRAPADRASPAGADGPRPWDEVTPRLEPRRFRSDDVRTLAPTGVVDALRLDLRVLFDLGEPGLYRVEVGFDDLRNEEGRPGRLSGTFRVMPSGGGG
jgi:hypothetical protein